MLACENLLLENNISTVFSGVSFTCLPGSLLIVHGPNGSGKTSLLRIITGIIKPSVGSIKWNEINVHSDINSFNSNLIYIGHKNALKPELTVLENLEFWSKMRGVSEFPHVALSYFNLERLKNTEVGVLSAGWKRRVELTKLMLAHASLWLLDEPETHLDEEGRILLIDLVQIKLQNRAVVIIASHHNYKEARNANYINLMDFASL